MGKKRCLASSPCIVLPPFPFKVVQFVQVTLDAPSPQCNPRDSQEPVGLGPFSHIFVKLEKIVLGISCICLR